VHGDFDFKNYQRHDYQKSGDGWLVARGNRGSAISLPDASGWSSRIVHGDFGNYQRHDYQKSGGGWRVARGNRGSAVSLRDFENYQRHDY
jgi:hypothetical protein